MPSVPSMPRACSPTRSKGAGSACLLKPQRMEQIVRSMAPLLSCPLTFKMRKVRQGALQGRVGRRPVRPPQPTCCPTSTTGLQRRAGHCAHAGASGRGLGRVGHHAARPHARAALQQVRWAAGQRAAAWAGRVMAHTARGTPLDSCRLPKPSPWARRLADWPYIRRCVDAAAGTGVQMIGNGDVFSWEDHFRWVGRGSEACLL